MDLSELWNDLAEELIPIFRRYRSQLSSLAVDTKADATLLTEADIAVEELIIDKIRGLDPNATVVAEEDGRTANREDVERSPEIIWVVDPIDGTAEFVKPGHLEFCSVVCVLRDLSPVAAFILAPEIGLAGTPLIITADRVAGEVRLNGQVFETTTSAPHQKLASVTRSRNTAPRAFEGKLREAGYEIKTRTTSQSLDMARTALDLTGLTEGGFSRFTLFHRTRQKMWDGLAGLCLGETVGLWSVDANGGTRVPVTAEALRCPEPTFDVTIMGTPKEVEWFLGIT